MTTVVVSGAVANKYRHGGSIWVRMSWAEALRNVGFDVIFVEQFNRGQVLQSNTAQTSQPTPPRQKDRGQVLQLQDLTPTAVTPTAVTPTAVTPTAVTPTAVTPTAVTPTAVTPTAVTPTAVTPTARETTPEIAVFDSTMEHFEFTGSAALVTSDGGVHGMTRPELIERFESAELLVNISGHLRDQQLLSSIRRRAFIDLDPGYTQVWLAEGHDVGAANHEWYFTVGANIGTPRCSIPTAGFDWLGIRQPVVLDRWPVADSEFSRFTTVGSWRGAYGPVTWQGQTYGVKAHEFRPLADLPNRAELPFEAVLDVHPADEADAVALRKGGWTLVSPDVTADPQGFANYIRDSGAEFSAAQGVYVHTNSGWCSDRTVRYLASGRPALVQDTGLGETLPTGGGLLTFKTPDEAVSGAHEILADYAQHRAAARRLAEDYFSPEKALEPLLDATGVTP